MADATENTVLKEIHLGFPEAAKAVRLDGPITRQLEHLALHLLDLRFAANALNEIDAASGEIAKEALWRVSIVYFIKCFADGSKSRPTPLKRGTIYKGDALAMQAFRYFDDLRNKHFVHDENAWAHSMAVAALNQIGSPIKVAGVRTIAFQSFTREAGNIKNLRLLVSKAIEWTAEKIDALCRKLEADLETLPHNELMEMPAPSGRVPHWDESAKPR